ncbi:YdbL family protein [Agarivorans sp. 1_MG-2023]|uniref:YdbL family protein n=1 Tax=Agarivorans sp. 1_MG-2023 TaxID=3062634 RepID=UPI0026E1E578|nr:YdbL family protein [Agarivorans sp. 1_MG-2023]MDO6764904.1 YdbL family protein [Agarivorans sp. 1_MG-2023]
MMKWNSWILALLLSLSFSVAAIDLDDAKTKGWVGEQSNGLLGVVSHSGEVKSLVESINQKRLAKYKQIAKENGLTEQQVATLAGKKAIERSSSGAYVQSPSGDWLKKP